MGQSELIEALEKLVVPASRGEIAKIMGEDPIKVSHWLARLVKHDEVETIKVGYEQAKEHNCKRRITLYYVKTEEVTKNNGRTTTKTRRTEIRTRS